MCSLRIESILKNGENIVRRFTGSLNENGTHKKGMWYLTNRRLIHRTFPEVKTRPKVKIDLKKTVIGGVLFGGIGGAWLGTKVDFPETSETIIYEDYRLSNLTSIDVIADKVNTLKAVFQKGKHLRTIEIEVRGSFYFKTEVEKAKRHLEEEIAEFTMRRKMMEKDESIQTLRSEIKALEIELKGSEDKVKDLDLPYATGRISKETYLEKMKEQPSERIEKIKSILETKREELAKRKERYYNSFST